MTARRDYEMKLRGARKSDPSRAALPASRVQTLLAWLIEADREFRMAQSMVEKFHRRF